jgi:pimeloyl-ACP methyl ester carboxylesterase
VVGERHPVLLLHGQPGSPRDWDRVVAEIGPRARTLAITRPGWEPGSAAEGLDGNASAALTALDRAQIPRAVVVGHSLGGAVAAWLAVSAPERVAGLVLAAPAADTRALTGLDHLLAAPLVGDMLSAGIMGAAGAAAATGPVRRFVGAGLQVDPEYLRSSGRMLLRPAAWRSFVTEQRMLIRELPELEQRLVEITVPTTVVAGTADRIVPLASAREAAQRIRGATLIELRGAHHILHQQRPAELAEIIVAAANL